MRIVFKRPGYAPYIREYPADAKLLSVAGKEFQASHIEAVRFNEAGIYFLKDADAETWDRPVNFEHNFEDSEGFVYGPVMFYREINGVPCVMTDEHIAAIIRFFEGSMEPDGLQKASEELNDENCAGWMGGRE